MTVTRRRRALRGFTLIEAIIVLATLGVAAITIMSLQGVILAKESDNKDLQTGAGLVQECAEQILATRRLLGYSTVNQNTCSALGNTAGFGAPTVTVTTNAGSPSCPNSNVPPCCASNSTTCTVQITLSKSGASLAPVTLQLVNY
jgi:Tfp pilus assembly protein PilV